MVNPTEGLPVTALLFLEELAANNNRDWFQANKKRYEHELRDPWKAFVSGVLERLAAVHPDFQGIEAKDCIFRIHRDTRFSADKTPYKLNVAAGISSGGKKSSEPGVYLQASPAGWVVGGGAYWLEKHELQAIREAIAAAPGEWEKRGKGGEFARVFGPIQGERNKRLPPEFKAVSALTSDIALKQFYYMGERPLSELTSNRALDGVMESVAAAEPVRTFLRNALHTA